MGRKAVRFKVVFRSSLIYVFNKKTDLYEAKKIVANGFKIAGLTRADYTLFEVNNVPSRGRALRVQIGGKREVTKKTKLRKNKLKGDRVFKVVK